jgi:hypothetical protein
MAPRQPVSPAKPDGECCSHHPDRIKPVEPGRKHGGDHDDGQQGHERGKVSGGRVTLPGLCFDLWLSYSKKGHPLGHRYHAQRHSDEAYPAGGGMETSHGNLG